MTWIWDTRATLAFFKENKKDESSRVILDGRCGLVARGQRSVSRLWDFGE
jgi:hypothetical protein